MGDDPRQLQGLCRHRHLGLKLAGIHSLLQAAEIYHHIALGKNVVKTALWQASVERHLTALKALDGNATA